MIFIFYKLPVENYISWISIDDFFCTFKRDDREIILFL